MNKENKRIIVVLVGFCLLFISLIVYISYFQIFRAENIKKHSYNKRLWINEENILRGSIFDRNGKLLAFSEKKDGKYNRYYPYSNLYSHIIGYSYREYGKAGLELEYNNTLLNISENTALNEIKNIVSPNSDGNSLKITIDHSLQDKARSLLKGKKGSIVAMNPTTGEIYAMVSLPDFNVANLKEDWKVISEDTNSPLINRATQGLYPPGSIFKIITSVAIIEQNILEEHDCEGNVKINGYIFKDYDEKPHGILSLKEALAKSCNTYFTSKSVEVGKDELGLVADRFMINKEIEFDLSVKKSQFNYKSDLDNTQLAASGMGQGDVLVTPLNMAMVASSIANNGKMVKPILVKEVISKNDKVIKTMKTEIISQVTDQNTAEQLKDMMIEVINSGTGTGAKIKNIQVAGKTGTAENSSGKAHAWFIGFAPADNPQVAVAVILEEEASSGGKSAAPIGKEIIVHTINNINN